MAYNNRVESVEGMDICRGWRFLIQYYNISMDGASTTSSYDVVVIRHRNQTLKSTPFQAVFADRFLKRDPRKNKLQLIVNEEVVDIPIRIDPTNGRVQFQKKYIRKPGPISDSSDISDDERSQHSTSREKLISSSIKGETLEGLKNEQAPKNFWQFAWLFSNKRGESKPAMKAAEEVGAGGEKEEGKLARIKEEPYQGEQSSKEPLFQLSLCGHLLAKKKETTSKEQLQRIFYANKIEYREFIKDPMGLINDANLIVRIDNSLYTWQLGATVLACKFAFGEEPDRLVDQVIRAKTKKSWFPIFGRDNVTKLDIQKQPTSRLPAPARTEEQEIVRYRKTPDHQLLLRMRLRPGQNQAKFVLQVSPGVFEEAEFQIFLWEQNAKVIISDIDGTITRSDVMGQLKTNYIHKGVCVLYNELAKRNYRLLYMTARAINQYGQTKKFLKKEVQENGKNLPPGPLLMSPDGYLKSFTREVIEKTPDQLKIKLLASVNEIFPSSKKPIIAGFGNRETDSIAYLRIQIPQDRIFCITEKSLITNYYGGDFQTTYPEMLQKIDDFFPLLSQPESQEASHPDRSVTKELPLPTDENEEEVLRNHRKLSHSEFYERSPVSSQNNELLSMSSRSRSEDGFNQDKSQDLQSLVQEYMAKAEQQGGKGEDEKRKPQ